MSTGNGDNETASSATDGQSDEEQPQTRFGSLLKQIDTDRQQSDGCTKRADHTHDESARFTALRERITNGDTSGESEPPAETEDLPTRTDSENIVDPLERVRQLIPEGLEPPSGHLDDPLHWQPQHIKRPREFYALWSLAFLTYGVGDVVTTGVGVFFVPEINESNPLVDLVLQAGGIPAFVVLKIVTFGVLLSISLSGAHDDNLFEYYGPVVAVILLGTALTSWNLLNMLVL